MSNQQPPPGAPPPSVTSATPLLTPEQSQPVDLATSSKGPQPLRIPTVPRPQLASPSRSGPTGAVTILGKFPFFRSISSPFQVLYKFISGPFWTYLRSISGQLKVHAHGGSFCIYSAHF